MSIGSERVEGTEVGGLHEGQPGGVSMAGAPQPEDPGSAYGDSSSRDGRRSSGARRWPAAPLSWGVLRPSWRWSGVEWSGVEVLGLGDSSMDAQPLQPGGWGN